ncbi:MAG: prepilin-type N-terminal cleavage/methylation domain-containing protein [Pseudomonadota bacterium]
MMLPIQVRQIHKDKRENGFTLIEMSMVMVIMGIIISIMMTVMPSLLKTGKIKEARAILQKYDLVLQGYAMTNYRLPFADSNGDGLENTNVFVGTLPYQTLGLTHCNDVWGQPVKYAVYGIAGGTLNLTDTSNKTTFDTAMTGIAGAAFNQNIVYVTPSDACSSVGAVNQAYVVASGGAKDLDGVNGYFDLCTGTAGAGFNEDKKIQALNYDDLVRPVSLGELKAKVSGP